MKRPGLLFGEKQHEYSHVFTLGDLQSHDFENPGISASNPAIKLFAGIFTLHILKSDTTAAESSANTLRQRSTHRRTFQYLQRIGQAKYLQNLQHCRPGLLHTKPHGILAKTDTGTEKLSPLRRAKKRNWQNRAALPLTTQGGAKMPLLFICFGIYAVEISAHLSRCGGSATAHRAFILARKGTPATATFVVF